MCLIRYAACAAVLCTLPAQAQIFAEADLPGGDAPVALNGSADATTPYVAITGSLTAAGATAADPFVGPNSRDIDCYAINVLDPAAFSASTANPATGNSDTTLLLFDSALNGLLRNDDGPGQGFRSTLPAGSLTGPAGQYVLCVSSYFLNALSDGGPIFPGGSGLESPSNSDTQLTAFQATTNGFSAFSYQVDLTGLGGVAPSDLDVDIAVTPLDVTVPSSGGKAVVTLSITNNEDVTVEGSLTATIEGRGDVRTNTGRLRPGQTRTYTYRLNFPRRLPDGAYLVTLTAEVDGDAVDVATYTVIKGDGPTRVTDLTALRLQAKSGDKAAQASLAQIVAEQQAARAARQTGVALVTAELVSAQAAATSKRYRATE